MKNRSSNLTFFCTSGKITKDNHYYINAFKSWKNTGINVTLFGPDDEETKSISEEYNIVWKKEPKLHGGSKLPILTDLLQQASSLCNTEYMCYINCDIIIFDEFLKTFDFLKTKYDDFFMVGQRWDWYESVMVNFKNKDDFDFQSKNMVLHSKTGVDYFVLKKEHIDKIEIPPFFVPRSRWDHWFAGISKKLNIPLVDTTITNTVVQPEPKKRIPIREEPYRSEVSHNEGLYAKHSGCDISRADVKTGYDLNNNIILL